MGVHILDLLFQKQIDWAVFTQLDERAYTLLVSTCSVAAETVNPRHETEPHPPPTVASLLEAGPCPVLDIRPPSH